MFKKSLLIVFALSVSLTGCGGSEPPAMTEMPSSMGSSLSPITPSGDGAITPVGDMSAGDAYDQSYAEGEAPAEEVPGEEVPAEEAPGDEPAADPGSEEPAAAPTGGDPDTNTMPDVAVNEPYTPSTTSGSGAASYSAEGSFMVDQDTFNQWQAVNVASDGINVYVAAVDAKSPAKGTVITMDASGGSWKDIGKSLLATISFGALGYKMDETITGLALDSSGNVLVTDTADRVYSMATPKYSITETEMAISGTYDVVSAGDNYYVASATGIQKFGSDLSAPSSFGSVTPTGGLGADSAGNVYAVVGTGIKKFDAAGKATDVAKDLSSPIDVAVDSSGNIFVLTSSSVVWFNSSGAKQGEFGNGEFQTPTAIAADSNGVWVVDAGSSHKDSALIKYVSGGDSGGSLSGALDDL